MEANFNAAMNCTAAETFSVFINSTDPDYFGYQQIYITILFTLGTLGILVNFSMIAVLICSKAQQQTALGLLVIEWIYQTQKSHSISKPIAQF